MIFEFFFVTASRRRLLHYKNRKTLGEFYTHRGDGKLLYLDIYIGDAFVGKDWPQLHLLLLLDVQRKSKIYTIESCEHGITYY